MFIIEINNIMHLEIVCSFNKMFWKLNFLQNQLVCFKMIPFNFKTIPCVYFLIYLY